MKPQILFHVLRKPQLIMSTRSHPFREWLVEVQAKVLKLCMVLDYDNI
jgi:hypothetical protein